MFFHKTIQKPPLPSIKFRKYHPNAVVPEYDNGKLYFYTVQSHQIHNGKGELLKTGLAVILPEEYQLQISLHMEYNTQIIMPNSPYIINSNYQEELFIPVINIGYVPSAFGVKGANIVKIESGYRIAQGIILPITTLPIEKVK